MEKLTIELDCNKKTCGKCGYIDYDEHRSVCKVFDERLRYSKNGLGRLPECIAVCKAQKE